nr:putative reverse transcriptase domain-containing protein [Tanacetum cinerariifolium]
KNSRKTLDINIDALYNILKQNQGDVNDAIGSKKKMVVVTSDPLALIAEKTNVSISKEKVVVSSDSDGSKADDFKTTDKVVLIKEKLRAVRDCQKSYADNRGKPLEFKDANLHVPLDDIKFDKTLRFVEEPVEIMDREVRSLKRSKISLVKVHWNSKHGLEFTWEREDHMKSKYPQLFVDPAVERLVKSWDEVFLRRGYSDTRNLK